jgi:hypothetical protein
MRRDVEQNRDNLRVLLHVIAALNHLGIAYALGGSWASALLGQPRFTDDADLTVEPFPGKEDQLCASFGPDYYVSLEAVRDAMRRRSSFNIIHTPTSFKIDIFVQKDRSFDRSAMARRRPMVLSEAPEQPILFVSAEDIILFKLEWYRIGGETSERQWTDILGVLKVQGRNLDADYLNHYAAELHVTDLLESARREAGLPS